MIAICGPKSFSVPVCASCGRFFLCGPVRAICGLQTLRSCLRRLRRIVPLRSCASAPAMPRSVSARPYALLVDAHPVASEGDGFADLVGHPRVEDHAVSGRRLIQPIVLNVLRFAADGVAAEPPACTGWIHVGVVPKALKKVRRNMQRLSPEPHTALTQWQWTRVGDPLRPRHVQRVFRRFSALSDLAVTPCRC